MNEGTSFVFGVDGDPRSYFARVSAAIEVLRLHVFLFGVHKRPDLINLHELARQVHQRLVHAVKFRAGRSKVHQSFALVFLATPVTRGRPDRIALN
jgi:hypothetical protein